MSHSSHLDERDSWFTDLCVRWAHQCSCTKATSCTEHSLPSLSEMCTSWSYLRMCASDKRAKRLWFCLLWPWERHFLEGRRPEHFENGCSQTTSFLPRWDLKGTVIRGFLRFRNFETSPYHIIPSFSLTMSRFRDLTIFRHSAILTNNFATTNYTSSFLNYREQLPDSPLAQNLDLHTCVHFLILWMLNYRIFYKCKSWVQRSSNTWDTFVPKPSTSRKFGVQHFEMNQNNSSESIQELSHESVSARRRDTEGTLYFNVRNGF